MFFKKKKAMSEMEANQELEQDNLKATENQDAELPQEIASEETEKLKNELNQSKDQYLRLVAEFDNFRKRTARERIELTQTAAKDMMVAMLAILDDSERAAKTMETATDIVALKEGIGLILGKLNSILTSKGLKAMETKSGDAFDAEFHEAITEIPAPLPELEGKVVDVVEKGYYLNDKIIRHAKVVVGK